MLIVTIGRQLDSVRVWKAFASVYSDELDPSLKIKRHVVPIPNMKLFEYIRPVTSPAFEWLTFLTLSNITCSRTDLIQISQLTNLGALAIGPAIRAPDIGLDDSVIRSWGKTATESNAFSVLRVLSCRSQREISLRVFDCLTQLPALAIFNVEDCDLGPEENPIALQRGWKYRTGKKLSDWLVKGGTKGAGWESIVHASFQQGGAFNPQAFTVETLSVVNALPLLHLSLGGPPKDAAVDSIGDKSLKSFCRVTPHTERQLDPIRSSQKRPLAESERSGKLSVRRKPTVSAAKLQNIEDSLLAFAS